ncbi:MAG: hypothetical protein SNJ29_07425 [Rikenellaceae bacterium]
MLLIGVSFVGAAQSKFDKQIQTSVTKTVEIAAKKKGSNEEQQKKYDALTVRWAESKALFAKKLPKEQQVEEYLKTKECRSTSNH